MSIVELLLDGIVIFVIINFVNWFDFGSRFRQMWLKIIVLIFLKKLSDAIFFNENWNSRKRISFTLVSGSLPHPLLIYIRNSRTVEIHFLPWNI